MKDIPWKRRGKKKKGKIDFLVNIEIENETNFIFNIHEITISLFWKSLLPSFLMSLYIVSCLEGY